MASSKSFHFRKRVSKVCVFGDRFRREAKTGKKFSKKTDHGGYLNWNRNLYVSELTKYLTT